MNDTEPKKKSTSTLKISLNEISKGTKKTMGTRVISGIILALIAIPALILGGWYFIAFVFITSLIAIFEIMHATKIKGDQWYVYVLVFLSIIGLTFWVFIKTNSVANVNNNYPFWDITKWVVESGFPSIQISSFLIPTMLLGLFIVVILDKKFRFDIAALCFLTSPFNGLWFSITYFYSSIPKLCRFR